MKAPVLAVLAILGAPPCWAGEAGPDPLVAGYCGAIADKAADARLAWQMDKLKKLQADINDKLQLLEARQRDLQAWVDRRDHMLKAANQSLVDIYAKMDPDAAATQLTQVDVTVAASILRQLPPRGASAILDVMEAGKAAQLVKIMAAVARESPPAAKSTSPAGGGT